MLLASLALGLLGLLVMVVLAVLQTRAIVAAPMSVLVAALAVLQVSVVEAALVVSRSGEIFGVWLALFQWSIELFWLPCFS
jgi:hypothetical protein